MSKGKTMKNELTEQELEQALKNYIERIEYLTDEKLGAAIQIKELYEEAEEKGLDAKALKEIIKLRKMDQADYIRQTTTETAIERYRRILGMEE